MTNYQIDLCDAIPDIAANLIYQSEFNNFPPDIFEQLVFEILEELIERFSSDPKDYLLPKHQEKIEQIAYDYLDQDFDKSELKQYFPGD
ncbi:hypothetical protein NIES4102_42210 (plasmid) [Chondrocystis sp. NIES-4102]|nr:hypothetical protein NIES4102_41060 [Chondrocystis sp. NIES-4102]BAZ47175.1 hypothetical protein NIES4102_42210 [Chondrocystis sp. NIES-4102]